MEDTMDDIFDDELKQILGARYQETNHNFTPEAQQRRRNNRMQFTCRIALLLGVISGFLIWANRTGLMSYWLTITGLIACAMVTGYNMAVCACHNQGWRGA
jgi:hypothetical protein